MSDLKGLRCFNPTTGKRDGGYCVWEGGGKCMKCEAADKIDDLTKQLAELEANLEAANERARHYITKSDDLTKQLSDLREAVENYVGCELIGTIKMKRDAFGELRAALPPQEVDKDE